MARTMPKSNTMISSPAMQAGTPKAAYFEFELELAALEEFS